VSGSPTAAPAVPGSRPRSPVVLSTIAYVHGERRDAASLDEPSAADVSAILRDVSTYRASGLPVWELAAKAGAACLDRGPGRPDLVVYVTENDRDVTASLGRIATALDLADVEHLAVSGYHCGNLGPALRVAADALAVGRCTRVLLLLADRARPGERIMTTGLSVLSDGAAACVVTSDQDADGTGVYTVDGTVTVVRVDPAGDSSAERGILGSVGLAATCVERLRVVTGHAPEDFQHLVLGNYRVPSQQFMAAALGLRSRLLLGEVADLGHCFSADLLVTLDQRRADGTLAAGDRVLAAATGPHSWSATALLCH
jgi:3-oxoacyl-[acyl-carrier-protein] synthase III